MLRMCGPLPLNKRFLRYSEARINTVFGSEDFFVTLKLALTVYSPLTVYSSESAPSLLLLSLELRDSEVYEP